MLGLTEVLCSLAPLADLLLQLRQIGFARLQVALQFLDYFQARLKLAHSGGVAGIADRLLESLECRLECMQGLADTEDIQLLGKLVNLRVSGDSLCSEL